MVAYLIVDTTGVEQADFAPPSLLRFSLEV